MKNSIALIILACTVCGGISTYAQKLPSTKEQYDFLQWYINKGPLPALSDSLLQMESISLRLTAMESATDRKFGTRDIDFFKKQVFNKNKPTHLDPNLLKSVTWKIPGSPSHPVTHISLPVFSRNRHVALINHTYAENATTVTGGTEVYIKDKDGNWVW